MANKPHDDSRSKHDDYVLPRKDYTTMPQPRDTNVAANVIRDKLDKIYASEPDAEKEEQVAEAAKPRSKHQQFMHELNHSGKDLAAIQTAWHNYYVSLPPTEKHQVWQEFYASNQNLHQPSIQLPVATPTPTETMAAVRSSAPAHSTKAKQARKDRRSASTVQKDIREHAVKRKLTAKQHLQSLLFGLSVGMVTLVVFLFSFFNEVIIAPFIQPARTSAATPLIVNSETVAPSDEDQVIIPKINVQIPLRFDVTSTSEETMQKELESGVAHYPTTAEPGENGNAAFFGHSSNNIFNKGKYKFAFVLLHELVPGDTFYITKDGKLFAYKVFKKFVVEPNQVEVLNPVDGHDATATLITCDPPGTSLRRLVVVGDQISPAVSTNSEPSEAEVAVDETIELAGNSPTLWSRIVGTNGGKAILGLIVVAAVVILSRRLSATKRPL